MSGLPDPYTNRGDTSALATLMDPHLHQHHHAAATSSQPMNGHQVAPQQTPMQSYGEDNLGESGYSTPNSKNRRIIREIIV